MDSPVSDRGAEGIDEAYASNNEARGRKTLSTHIRVECLGGDDALQRRVCEAVDNLEEEVGCQGTFTEGQIGDVAESVILLVKD